MINLHTKDPLYAGWHTPEKKKSLNLLQELINAIDLGEHEEKNVLLWNAQNFLVNKVVLSSACIGHVIWISQ